MERIEIRNIATGQSGFERLAELAARTRDLQGEDIELDLSSCRWLDGNMCAPLCAIIHAARERFNKPVLGNLNENVEKLLSKNGVALEFGRTVHPDAFQTTITYKKFGVHQSIEFFAYLERNLRGKEMPRMTAALDKRFKQSLAELFENASTHSRSRAPVHSCGQYFPRKRELKFTVVDVGVGIQRNVSEYSGREQEDIEAIDWVMAGNSTKRASIPGGLGLKLLQEFVKINEGGIYVVSGHGYWVSQKGEVERIRLGEPFPGTAVTISVNTADQNSYRLSGE